MTLAVENPDLPRRAQHGASYPEGFQLLFPAGARPDSDELVRLIDSPDSGIPARITHRPAASAGWLEVLCSGLAFDLIGLPPASAVPVTSTVHAYGFDGAAPVGDLEAIALVPSGHVAAGLALQPVLRAMAALAANLALRLPALAVVWQPAQTLMDPGYFSRLTFNWLSGGAFPALGLTALTPTADGSIASSGLSYFIGQELQLEARTGEPQAESVKLAIRLVDYLIRYGPLKETVEIEQAEGMLVAEPSPVGKRVWVWRQ